MVHATPHRGPSFLLLTAASVYALSAWAQVTPPTRAATPAKHAAPKHTWQNNPADMLPDVEVVPRHAPVPPSVRSQVLKDQQQKLAAAKSGESVPAVHPGPPTLAANMRAPRSKPVEASKFLLSPQQNARHELECLHNDAKARAAYYDDLRRLVDQVRASQQDNSRQPATPRPCSE